MCNCEAVAVLRIGPPLFHFYSILFYSDASHVLWPNLDFSNWAKEVIKIFNNFFLKKARQLYEETIGCSVAPQPSRKLEIKLILPLKH
jgi:hypothetical protein